MKILFASDIHGDLDSTYELINIFNNENPDRLILLGDILYHGPRNDLPDSYNPKAVISILNQHKDKIIAVRGNCDAEVDQMVLDFPIMSTSRYVESDGIRMFITHGHHYNMDTPPILSQGELLIHGHTHIPKCENFGDDNYCLNPGSISIPKNGFPKSYMIYENKKFVIKSIDVELIFSLSL
jgi:putative phosphoesterase